ncbi:hypothetical protein [Streptomyces sp. NPDC093795]|uniref:hypothetical protein n=1 Tax=Streptomyces sp. NPDC093795 TaxID=3366051 RepID=UPI0037FDDD0F
MTTPTNVTTPAALPGTVPLHFILTIQTDDGRTVTSDGTVLSVPGAHTRTATFARLREQAMEHWGLSRCVVLFFSLEPNQL